MPSCEDACPVEEMEGDYAKLRTSARKLVAFFSEDGSEHYALESLDSPLAPRRVGTTKHMRAAVEGCRKALEGGTPGVVASENEREFDNVRRAHNRK